MRAALPDGRGPEFAGVRRVELSGLDRFTLSWEPATDDVAPAEELRYRVYHIVEPYRELTDETEAIYTSEPGVTSVTIAHDAPPGRFYVRAADPSGNLSAPTPGLLQRSERPRVSAADGTVVARITACEELGSGSRAVCVGEEGFAGIVDANGWTGLDLGVVASFSLTRTPAGVFAYSDIGHLFSISEEGDAELVDLMFLRRVPTLPLRQFAVDPQGLRYWLDGDGRAFVGAGREFMTMPRPLALPGNDCRALRGLAFASDAGFAICAEGVAYSSSARVAAAPWMSLTPNADFALPFGLRGALAADDSEAILYDALGVRRVGIGGWAPLLLVNWHEPGIHPMDIPESPPPITRVGQVFERDGELEAVTDLGLLRRNGSGWDVVPGTDGRLVGVVGTASRAMTLVYDNGAIGRLDGGTRRWIVAPRVEHFVAAFTVRGGVVAFDRDGVSWTWRHPEWTRLAGPVPGGVAPVALAGDVNGALFAIGSRPGELWRAEAGRWTAASFVYEAPVRPTARPAAAPDAPLELAPPPALSGVPAALSPGPTPSPGRFVALDVAPDGRGVAITDHQIWWRLSAGWRYLGERSGALSAVMLDAGESYVIVEDGAPVRCWRGACGETAAQVDGAPGPVLRTLPSANGPLLVTEAGEVYAFEPGSAPTGAPLIDPAFELPVGAFRAMPAVGRYARAARGLVYGDGYAVLLDSDGGVLERESERWELQTEANDILAMVSLGDRWAMLTDEGLFVLGSVEPAVAHVEAEP